jgi:Holliday junction resolvase RusA-like endonuclease
MRTQHAKIELIVPGDPRPQPRPTADGRGKFIRMVSAKAGSLVIPFKESVTWLARLRMSDVQALPAVGPVFLDIELRLEASPGQEETPRRRISGLWRMDKQRNDWDNLAKSVCDALNGCSISTMGRSSGEQSRSSTGAWVKIRTCESSCAIYWWRVPAMAKEKDRPEDDWDLEKPSAIPSRGPRDRGAAHGVRRKYDDARKSCRDMKKKVDGAREELRRVNKLGPDPQTDLPFVTEGEAGLEGLSEGDAVAVASYNKKKAKAVAATKKAAKKKTALPF